MPKKEIENKERDAEF